ncbi:hypothetical protein SAMN05444722_1533 [Rhodovulum sp. ES.010]|uniref:hypothetical protein n=1 Tax=Rhodovulum sp. ES.010 TaxID=1882821 RepID=UPI00092C1938|nr:hypothetical protein [Rhodovulum sp. ES.010]SIO34053.1 hypothetical protein SAMN05444722_1533 [Rhodovulum sp. ES.010]
MGGRAIIVGALVALVLVGAEAQGAAPECDAECQRDLREKILRDLRALNDGEVMA